MQHTLLIAGAGQIGIAITHLMMKAKLYRVVVTDLQLNRIPAVLKKSKALKFIELDINDHAKMMTLIREEKITALISCLPYFCNKSIAEVAYENKLHYFDLTEDVETVKFIRELAKDAKQSFTPQCGLAPGFINIIANDLMQHFDTLDSVKLRCGGLPVNTSNALKYAFTWSIDGLLNEYNQPCEAIKNNKLMLVSPLENSEEIQIDGLKYEAFNTSGGIGSLAHLYEGKVHTLNYKSIRYPGHRDLMAFLMHDLKLSDDLPTLKKIIQHAIPQTTDDVVIVFVSVNGDKDGKLIKKSFVRKYYPTTIDDLCYSALQLITAASAAAVIHLVLTHPKQQSGYIEQACFKLNDLFDSPFKQYLQGKR